MGSFRSSPDNVKHSSTGSGNGLQYAVTHMCGWRIYMEDAHIAQLLSDKQSYLFAVFDGHGGAEVSEFVRRHFVKELQSNKSYKDNKEQALRETFMKMDVLLRDSDGINEIRNIQKEMREKDNGPKYDEDSHAGCTANVVLVTPDWIYCANAGDSRAICYQGKKLFELSKDHKPQDAIQLDRITKAGGSVNFGRVNGGLNLSRAIGDLQYKKGSTRPQDMMITANPDITKTKNENVEFIIMGCDGIWEVKTNNDMIDWVRKRLDNNIPLQKITEELLDELVSRDSGNQYGMDNMSAILVKFNTKK